MTWNRLSNVKKVEGDRKTTIIHDFIPGHEYEFTVRSVGPDGTQQPMESAARETIVIEGKTDAPTAPTALTATGILNAISLEWTNPTNYDLKKIEIWRASFNSIGAASKIAEVTGTSYIDPLGVPNVSRYYWVKAVNTTNTLSDFYPSATWGISGRSKGIEATDIDDFSVTATKMFNKTIILANDSWTNNSPGAGSIAWNAHSIVYNGASYPITAGNTALAYVYWTIGDATYSTSATHPTLGTIAFMIAHNASGTHTLVWNSSANMVIGNAFIVDLSVEKITAGTISSKVITLAVDAGVGDCYIGAGKTDFTNTQAGFILGLDDSDADKPKLYIGDATTYLNWTGSALSLKGSIVITGGSGIASLTDAGALAVEDTVGAGDCDATIISGGKIITTLLTATNIQTGTLTAITVQTALVNNARAVIDGANNRFDLFDASNNSLVRIDDNIYGGGSTAGIKCITAAGTQASVMMADRLRMDSGMVFLAGGIVEVKGIVAFPQILWRGIDENNNQTSIIVDTGQATFSSFVDAVGGFKDNGVAGIDNAAAGIISAITIAGGIITAVTKVAHIGEGGAVHANAGVAGAAGFMTDADKTKLDGTGDIITQNKASVNFDGGAIDGVTIGTNAVATQIAVDNLDLNGNTISSTDTNGDIDLTPDGTGAVDISSDVEMDAGKKLYMDGGSNTYWVFNVGLGRLEAWVLGVLEGYIDTNGFVST